jgi:hypothetical protein
MTQLMLPVFLHGMTQDVKKAARRAASRVAKGTSIAELADELRDAASMPGLIPFKDEYRWTEGHLPHFHGYQLVSELHREYKTFKDPRWDHFLDEMARLPWLICCCLGEESSMLFDPPERAHRLVTAVRDHWDTLNSPGNKFYSDRPTCLWRAQRTLGYSLGRLGASREELVEELFDPAYQTGARPSVIDRYLA